MIQAPPNDSTAYALASLAMDSLPIQSLLVFLEDTDPYIKTLSARKLHLRPHAMVVDRAKSIVDSSRGDEREFAAFLLGQLGTAEIPSPFRDQVIPLLAKLLDDEVADVRAGAIIALGKQHAHELLPNVLVHAESEFADVRGAVASALGTLLDPADDCLALHALLNDPDDEVRDWAQISVEVLAHRAGNARKA